MIRLFSFVITLTALLYGEDYTSLNNAGQTYFFKCDYKNAVVAWTKAAKHRPYDADHLNKIGVAYTLSGRYDRAAAFFDSIIALHPRYARTYFNKGILFLRWNRYEEAVEQLRLCLNKDPQYPEAYYHIGVIYQREGDWGRALEEYQNELNVNAWCAKAWRGYIMALREQRLGQGKHIQNHYRITPSMVAAMLIIISVLAWLLYFSRSGYFLPPVWLTKLRLQKRIFPS